MSAPASAIETGEVGGVPAYYVRAPGPTSAGLIFRVGQADETLARRGLTHLVEHLALHRLGLTDYHSNGATGPSLTHFYLEGSEPDVAGFLHGVCAGLTDLPLDRLERERDILATEAARRSPSPLPSLRYGAQTFGLTSYPEWGVESARPEEVAAWSREWFTRDNAALWVTGPRLPAGLAPALPAGSRRPPPKASPTADTLPGWVPDGESEVLLTAVVGRSAAASAYAWVLGRELWRVLRQEGGYSYTATAEYQPRDAEMAEIAAYADAHHDKADAVVGGFLEVLAAMKAGRISEEAVAAARARQVERFDRPAAAAEMLAGYAGDSLLGRAPETLEQLRAQAAAVTTDAVRAVAAEAHRSALLVLPEGRSADLAGFTALRPYSRHEVPGQVYQALDDEDLELVVGRDGISLRTGRGPLTVRFAQCAARLHWPDGRRVLIGLDGTTVAVEPTLFGLDNEGRTGLDARLDPAVVVRRPAREAWLIPQPERPAAAKRAPRPAAPELDVEPDPYGSPAQVQAARRAAFRQRLVLWALVAATVVLALAAFTVTSKAAYDGTAAWPVAILCWALCLVPGYPASRIIRKRQPF